VQVREGEVDAAGATSHPNFSFKYPQSWEKRPFATKIFASEGGGVASQERFAGGRSRVRCPRFCGSYTVNRTSVLCIVHPSCPPRIHQVSASSQSGDADQASFLERNQFLIYRLFSLAGLVPVGAFLVVHLLTNASVLAGPDVFQSRVDMIHSLGPLLPVVEWAFIFLPMMFHAGVGMAIIAGGLPNVGSYPYAGNIRYTLQRVTGMIAFAFILWHIWQLHAMGKPLGGGAFDPHHAASTASAALRPMLVAVLYAIGVLSAVYHLANGLWSLGVTWGIWTSPAAMRRASWFSVAVGVALGAAGLGGLAGMRMVDVDEARAVETRMSEARALLEGKVEPAEAGAGAETAPAH
jgi:succinate dehydrogenase / fumarate reductase cytochrome b subunit